LKTCTKCATEQPPSNFYKHGAGLRSQCKSCVDARNRERYFTVLSKDPEFMERNRVRGREWHRANLAKNRVRIAENHKAERLRCINHYGPGCACCGEMTYEFLAVDHINGGGEKQRRLGISKICRWLISNNFPGGYRILCHNCNQALGFHGHCPHGNLTQKKSGTLEPQTDPASPP
jgi:hypothetical protein